MSNIALLSKKSDSSSEHTADCQHKHRRLSKIRYRDYLRGKFYTPAHKQLLARFIFDAGMVCYVFNLLIMMGELLALHPLFFYLEILIDK